MNDFNALLEDFADTLPKLNGWFGITLRILAVLILISLVVYFCTGCNTVESFIQTKDVSYPVHLVANCYRDEAVEFVSFHVNENKEVSLKRHCVNKGIYKIILTPENKEKLILELVYQNKDLISVIIYTNDMKNIGFQFHRVVYS